MTYRSLFKFALRLIYKFDSRYFLPRAIVISLKPTRSFFKQNAFMCW